MPPETSRVTEELWAYLRPSVDYVMTVSTELPHATYIGIYTTVYNYCEATMYTPDGKRIERIPACADLYKKLSTHLISHVEIIYQKFSHLEAGEAISYYENEWDRYLRGAQYLNRLFAYLNRDWVTREQSEGNTTVYSVHKLALLHWKKDLVLRIQNEGAEKLSSIVMRAISDDFDSDGGLKGSDRIKVLRGVTDSFLALDLAEDEPFKLCMTHYTRRFKPPS
ncbi:Cullin repeat-like-containing domain protein [Ephemerocybe angulata]|uniref:Cullin repeat-like-containing domain protein n=1 Tax=Ephemerocybe angulata TaxID=980116 RepID=A0A8H6IAS4_9AGAR|nr:Cullin repeat-like-containing domain protein [Tulosesus angulatus]